MKNSILSLILIINITGCVGFIYSSNSDIAVGKSLDPVESRYLKKPNTIADQINPDGSEMYVVKDELKWCGLTIWAIIPIPLWLPVCRTHTEVTYRHGKPIQVAHQSPTTSEALCGPFVPLLGIGGRPTGFCHLKK